MRPIRFRLDKLMIWVAVIAINLATLRFLFATRSLVVLAGGMMAWIMIQVGIFQALRNRRGKRPYWLGFASGGSIAVLSIVSTNYLPSSDEGSIWGTYFVAVEVLFERAEPWLARLLGNGAIEEIAGVFLYSVAWFLPLWLAALAGGHLCRLLFLRRDPLANPA